MKTLIILTLILSQSVFAQGQKQNQQRQNQVSQGTNGGGGGGVIICPGQEPILTDFWELKQRAPVETVQRLEKLRNLTFVVAFKHFVKNFFNYLNGEYSIEVIEQHAGELLDATDKAISEGGAHNAYKNHYRVLLNTLIADPKDSGIVSGLSETDCYEERVIVSKFNITGSPRLTIQIRRPDIFMRLPVFDQIWLLVGHELIHGTASGNTGRLTTLGRTATNSEMTRKLISWMAMATPESFKALNSLRPKSTMPTIECAPYSMGSERPDFSADRMSFVLHMDEVSNQTVVELRLYKDESVWLPTFATLPLSPRQVKLPKDFIRPRMKDETGNAFDLEIEYPNYPVHGELRQIEPAITGVKNVGTGMAIEFYQGRDYSFAKVVNEKGDVQFDGRLMCYRRFTN